VPHFILQPRDACPDTAENCNRDEAGAKVPWDFGERAVVQGIEPAFDALLKQ
jgi:hypothetical protein